jgi:serine phosphatase RsbU (regulator of sigma subunit)/anti-sigma regulatory factor (Ser/Thr protein kinase)
MSESAPERVTASFPAHGSSVSGARRFVRDALRGWALDTLVDDALLLVSELVTNAVVHAGTLTEVSCTRRRDGVQIDVTDRYPGRWLPMAPPIAGDDAEGGRGLALAAALAAGWGVAYTHTSKRVWFVLGAEAGPGDAPDGPLPGRLAVVDLDDAGVVAGLDEAAAELLGPGAIGTPWAHLARGADGAPLDRLLALPRWQGGYTVSSAHSGSVAVIAWHVAAAAGGTTCLLSPQRPAPPVAPVPAAAGDDLGLPDAAGLTLTLDVLLEQLVERACELLGGDAGFAVVTNEDEDEVLLRAGVGLGPARRGPARLPAADEEQRSPSAWQAPRRYPDPDDGPAAGLLRRSELCSAVTVPLLVADRLVGAVGVAAREPDRFTEADVARLERALAPAAPAVQIAKVIELERLQRGRLSFLAEASELLAGTLDRDMTLALLGRLVVPRLAPWCAVYELDQAGAAQLVYAWHADEDRVDGLRERLGPVTPPGLADSPHPWRPPGGAPLPATVLPLLGRGRPIGTLVLGTPERRLPRDVLELAEDLSRRAGLALDNARLYTELTATAQAFQHSLLPPELPVVPGTDIGVAYAAAGSGNEVGGDFYDVFRLGAGRWGFAIGDVCGKGPEAAAVTGLARQTMRLLGQDSQPVPEVLARLNEAILAEGPRSRFITLVTGTLTPERAGVELSLVCAGHPLPLLLRPDGAVRPVGTAQPLLGVLDEVAFSLDVVRLEPGDTLVCVTDGVTERRSEHGMFGEEGLVAVLRRCAGRTAPQIAAEIHRTVVDFSREPARDDLAVLVLRAT